MSIMTLTEYVEIDARLNDMQSIPDEAYEKSEYYTIWEDPIDLSYLLRIHDDEGGVLVAIRFETSYAAEVFVEEEFDVDEAEHEDAYDCECGD